MIPKELLASDPVVGGLAKELSERRICRLCLSEVETLAEIDVVWKMKIVSCFPLVTIGSDRLPKLICENCGKFVNKCYEFRQLLKKSEQMLVTYPLTGSWSGELKIPHWLRENDRSEQVHAGKKRKFVDELPQVGSVRVRSHESMSLQSPTITPGSMELTQSILDEDQPMQEVINTKRYPTVIHQLTHQSPTISPTTYQSSEPVLQSSQPSSSQYPSSMLLYNSTTLPVQSKFRTPTISITPVNQPQMITVQNVSQRSLNQGYLQQPTQILTYNTNYSNATQLLPSYQQPAVQPQPQSVQMPFTNVNLNGMSGLATQLQPTESYQQSQIPQTTLQQPQQHQKAMTQTRIKPQQPQLAKTQTPTRSQKPLQLQNPVKCHVCQAWFLMEHHLKYHTRKHNAAGIAILSERALPPRRRRCWLCTHPTFATQGELVEHLRVHEAAGFRMACDFCPLVFADEALWTEHFRTMHGRDVEETLRLNGKRQ